MSWDAMIFRHGPDDLEPTELGPIAEVRQRIAAAAIDDEGLEIVLDATAGVVTVVHIHARGSLDPVPRAAALARALGADLFDSQSGELLGLDAPSSETWHEFRGQRDATVGAAPPLRPRNYVLYRLVAGPPRVVADPGPSFAREPLGELGAVRALFDRCLIGLSWRGQRGRSTHHEVRLFLDAQGRVDTAVVRAPHPAAVVGLCAIAGWSGFDTHDGEFCHLQPSARSR